MNAMRILILEDEDLQREVIQDELSRRGFRAEGAKTSTEALNIADRMGKELGLVVLDMRLEGESVNGAEVGIQIRNRFKDDPPIFLISSAYSKLDYFQTALSLGAAAYLHKEGDLNDLIRHVRALYLRRLISSERPEVSPRLRRIAESSGSRLQAIMRFCATVVQEALDEALGAPYVLLLSSSGGTSCCGSSAGELPLGSTTDYNTITALAFGMADASRPFVLESGLLKLSEVLSDSVIASRLDGAAFLSLAEDRDFRLSLGILRAAEPGSQIREDPKGLAEVLARYFRSTLISQILGIAALWAQLDERRKALLSATSHLCLYVGQQQVSILDEATPAVKPEASCFQKLRGLADDLYNTGSLLASLGDRQRSEDNPFGFSAERVTLAGLVRSAWDKLAVPGDVDLARLELKGDCTVQGDVDDIYFAISRILQWLADRMLDTPDGVEPGIHVCCSLDEAGTTITFEDRSRRLDSRLRRELFMPFFQTLRPPATSEELKRPALYMPLYLAKMLIELRNGGNLEDHSEELDKSYGHRLILRFPPPSKELGFD